MSETSKHSLDAAVMAQLVHHARERRRPTTAEELAQSLAEAGHPIEAHNLLGHLKVVSRHCQTMNLPDVASLVYESTGAPAETWQPELPTVERLVNAWDEQAKLWLFDEWLRYEEAILMLQRLA